MFPGYTNAEEISRGNQGVVYRAIQEGTHRRVAIKLPLYAARMNDAQRKRFFREIELIARVSHPGIVPIFHSGVTADGAPFYVMDFIEGVPLDQYVREHQLGLEQILTLVREVCEAMDHAHHRSVVHRDLKPSNILVDADGKPTVVDFGLARLFAVDEGSSVHPKEDAITGKQDVIGTMRYMSPEHALGTPDQIEPRSDVYSLGVILYELLTGHSPYPDVPRTGDVMKFMDAMLRHITETPAVSPRKRWESSSGVTSHSQDATRGTRCPIDSDLETIVLRSLSKERERRYQSAGAMAADIRRYLAGEPIEARADSAVYKLRVRTRTLVRRHRFLAHVAAVLAAAALSFSVVKHGLYRWTDAQRWLLSSAYDLTHRAKPEVPYRHVRVAAWKDGVDLGTVASELGLADVDLQDVTIFRRFYGKLFEQLAGVEPGNLCKAVVVDHLLSVPSRYDEALVRGVEALKVHNIPVIVGVRWQLDSNQPPSISQRLSRHVRFGSPGVDPRDVPWILHLAVQRGLNDPRPNLVLEAYAAAKHPDARTEYRLDLETQVIEIRYWEADIETTIGRRTKYESEFVKVSQVGPLQAPSPSGELQPGDIVFGHYTELPDDSYLLESTIDIVQLLKGDAQLLKQLAGKIVVVGTERLANRDVHPYGERQVAGVHGIVAGVESLVNRRFVRLPSQGETLLIPVVAASLGVLVACLPFGAGRKFMMVAFVLLAIQSCCLLIFNWRGLFIDSPIPGLAVVIAFAFASKLRGVHAAV